jgi:hypothetical protein
MLCRCPLQILSLVFALALAACGDDRGGSAGPAGTWVYDPVRAAERTRDAGRPRGTSLSEAEWRRLAEAQIARARGILGFTLTLEASGRAVRDMPQLNETHVGRWKEREGHIEVTLDGKEPAKAEDSEVVMDYVWDGKRLSFWTMENVRIELERAER